MDMASQVHQALARMEDALEKNENRTAFSLFRKDIIKILCGAGVLKVCSPYYYKSGNIKMDKVAGEREGAFQYYYSGNGCRRSLRPHGESFACGRRTAYFLEEVKKLLGLFAENTVLDPWEIFRSYMDSNYFDPENYLDKAGVYAFPHNRHSRDVTKTALEPYAEKYYGTLDAGQFVDLYQALDRVYTTYGFPFSCTNKGWFFEGYDSLYKKVLEEGVWTLRNLWVHEPGDWLLKQMGQYPDIELSYAGLVKALQNPRNEALLCRIFPFRLTGDTLQAGCGINPDDWEVFIFKVSKVLHFAERCNGRKNVDGELAGAALKEASEILKTVRCYMDSGNLQ